MSSRMWQYAMAIGGLGLTGCSPTLASVKVDPATGTLEAVNATAQFQAAELDPDGKALKKPVPVTWTSDHSDIASVGNTGVVTAKKTGRATVTAAAGKIKATASVDVHIPAKVIGQDVGLTGVGKTKDVVFQVADEAGEPMADFYSKIVVTVADPKVASVAGPSSGSWTFTAAAGGKTQFSVSAGGATQNFNLSVDLPEVTDLKIGQTALKMKVGETQHLSVSPMAAGQPVDGVVVTYSTSEAKVATADPDGTVHAIGKGKATITASAGAKTGAVAVTVKR